MCGEVDEEGNHIVGYDHACTDAENKHDIPLWEYYKLDDTLCGDCLFK